MGWGPALNTLGRPAPSDVPGYLPTQGPIKEGRISRGARLTGVAFNVIKSDRGLLSLMLVAVLVDIAITGSFLALAASIGGDLHRRAILLAVGAAASYPVTVVGTFLNVALLSTVSRRWSGQPATVTRASARARALAGDPRMVAHCGDARRRAIACRACQPPRMDRALGGDAARHRVGCGDVLRDPGASGRRRGPPRGSKAVGQDRPPPLGGGRDGHGRGRRRNRAPDAAGHPHVHWPDMPSTAKTRLAPSC